MMNKYKQALEEIRKEVAIDGKKRIARIYWLARKALTPKNK